jgi:hypothetical protein
MKTYAGDVFLNFPGGWSDDSTYVYRDADNEGVEVRVERSPVAHEATPLSRILIIEERLKMLDPSIELVREETIIGGRAACTLRTSLKRQSDTDQSLMFVASFKARPEVAITVTVTAEAAQKRRFESTCKSVAEHCRVVEV